MICNIFTIYYIFNFIFFHSKADRFCEMKYGTRKLRVLSLAVLYNVTLQSLSWYNLNWSYNTLKMSRAQVTFNITLKNGSHNKTRIIYRSSLFIYGFLQIAIYYP